MPAGCCHATTNPLFPPFMCPESRGKLALKREKSVKTERSVQQKETVLLDINAMTSCILESETNKDFREYGLNYDYKKKKKKSQGWRK